MTHAELLVKMARLNRKIVLCVNQAECDRMELELAALELQAAPATSEGARRERAAVMTQ